MIVMDKNIIVVVVLIIGIATPPTTAIECFECDEIPGIYNKKCPGGRKINFGDKYKVGTVRSRFKEWPPSAPFHSLNRDFTLN